MKYTHLNMEFNFETNNSLIRQEPSRIVKICILCYKCVLGGLALFLTAVQIVILTVLTGERDIIDKLQQMLTNYSRNVLFTNI